MKCFWFLVFALVLAGCCGCFRQETVVVREVVPQPVPVVIKSEPVKEVVVVEKTRTRSLLGHVVVGTTLVLADVVSIVLPIGEETEKLRTYYREGGY